MLQGVQVPALDNVIVLEPEWASLIFAGLKTLEVRRAPPPSFCTGLFGIAVSGVPDLVFGRVRVSGYRELSFAEIEGLANQTRIFDERLNKYLRGQTGYCWSLEDPIFFTDPVTFFSDGQSVKGAPRAKHQPEAELQILASPGEPLLHPGQAVAVFRKYALLQKANKMERAARKASLFALERQRAKTRRETRHTPLPLAKRARSLSQSYSQ